MNNMLCRLSDCEINWISTHCLIALGYYEGKKICSTTRAKSYAYISRRHLSQGKKTYTTISNNHSTGRLNNRLLRTYFCHIWHLHQVFLYTL